ncbi:FG-GAP repeat domain-containing protein [Flindersiella endophytica]
MLAFGSATGLNRGYELVPPTAQPISAYCRDVVSADFDNDGYADIVVGSGQYDPAPLQVIAGGPGAGFRSKLDITWITHTAVPGELSAGDVTGDGFSDLLVGAEFNGSTGGLTLYTGSAEGLVATPAQRVTTPGSSQTAVGDVDGDGFADVAAANTTVGPSGIRSAGLARLWYGSSGGLDTGRGFTLITQDTAGVPDTAEPDDRFGVKLAIGDADGDGFAELAIGCGGEDVGTTAAGLDAGTITVIYGGGGGLDFGRTNHFTQNSAGVPDAVEAGDNLGLDLLFRELDKVTDGRANLIASAALEDGTVEDEGAVFVLKSTSTGLTGQGSVMFGPRQLGITPSQAVFGGLD